MMQKRESQVPRQPGNCWLLAHARNVTSQSGEDGIIQRILQVIGENDRWCVEFGAWDGVYLSNTYNLIKNQGYAAVLIEADLRKFQHLKRNYRGDRVVAINALVGFEDHNNLDVILKDVDIPYNFDVLSIDIDGNDYHVWDAVQHYRPKVVVIEFNMTIPNCIDFVQPKDMNLNQGSGIRSLVNLGKKKDYELVAATEHNCLFVDGIYFPLFHIEDNSLAVMRSDEGYTTYLFCGYDGTVFVRGYGKLHWHGLPYSEAKMQQLTKFLRKYPGHYGWGEKVIATLYRSFRQRNFKELFNKLRNFGASARHNF